MHSDDLLNLFFTISYSYLSEIVEKLLKGHVCKGARVSHQFTPKCTYTERDAYL
jgi:hypothetical protein